LLQCFLGGQDEEWFILIHIDIEKKAGKALKAIEEAQAAVVAQDAEKVEAALIKMRAALTAMYEVLGRMPERCDPYIYFHRVGLTYLAGEIIHHCQMVWSMRE